MPRRRHPIPVRAVTLATIALLLCATVVTADGFVISGHSDGLYDGDEWTQLLRSMATIVVVLIAAAEDDETDGSHRGRELCDPGLYEADDGWCDELGLSVPQVQFSAGMGYALSPRLTVGARYLYRQDFNDNDIARLWGGGPEATLSRGNSHAAVQPFVGGYLLFARGEQRLERRALSRGTSVGIRAGFRVRASPGVGLLFQSGFQNDRFDDLIGAPLRSRGVTVGMGLRFELE